MGKSPWTSSLLCLQWPITGPQPEPDKSSPQVSTFFHFFKIHFSIIFLYTLMTSKQLLTFSSSPQKFIFGYCAFHAYYMRCPCHLFDFIIPKIFVKSPNYEVLHYVAFIILLSLPPTYSHILFSTHFTNALIFMFSLM